MPSTHRPLLALACAGLALLILGDRSATATAAPSPAFRLELSGSGAAARGQFVPVATDAATPVIVSQKNKTFDPGTLTLRVGQAIEIANDDTTVHNAYCQNGGFKYNSGPQQPGSKSVVTFTTPGVYELRCAIHPKMRLAVNVTE